MADFNWLGDGVIKHNINITLKGSFSFSSFELFYIIFKEWNRSLFLSLSLSLYLSLSLSIYIFMSFFTPSLFGYFWSTLEFSVALFLLIRIGQTITLQNVSVHPAVVCLAGWRKDQTLIRRLMTQRRFLKIQMWRHAVNDLPINGQLSFDMFIQVIILDLSISFLPHLSLLYLFSSSLSLSRSLSLWS